MSWLALPQEIQFKTYLDCKKRTKKKIGLDVHPTKKTSDERLIFFLLDNSSIVEHESERSFSRVADAVQVACRQMCPGQWCTRSHCESFSSSHAYHCTRTRPAVCKIYKKYIEGQKERELKKSQL